MRPPLHNLPNRRNSCSHGRIRPRLRATRAMKLVSKADYRDGSGDAIVATLRGTDECVRPYTTRRADETRVVPDAFVRGCAQRAQ